MLIAIVLILQAFVCFKLYKNDSVHPILAISIIFNTGFWYFVPGFIALLIKSELIQHISLNLISNDYIVLYSLESVLYLCAIIIGVRLFKINVTNRKVVHSGDEQLSSSISMILIVGFIAILILHNLLLGDITYIEANKASNYDESRSYFLLELGQSLLLAAVIYIAVTVKNNNRILFFSSMAILVSVYYSVLGGSRIAFVLPVFIFIVRAAATTKWLSIRTFWVIIASLLFIMFIVLPLSSSIAELRIRGSLDYTEVFNKSNFENSTRAATIALFTKFNNTTTGLRLIDRYGAGSAGLEPYVGSALVFLPRAIFNERPVAGSVDGTISGTPSRLVPKSYLHASDSKNVGVSPLAISIWQMDWVFGSILILFSGIINLHILNYLLSRNKVIYKLLAVYTINISTFVGIFPSPDVVLKNLVFLCFVIGAINLANVRWKLPAKL